MLLLPLGHGCSYLHKRQLASMHPTTEEKGELEPVLPAHVSAHINSALIAHQPCASGCLQLIILDSFIHPTKNRSRRPTGGAFTPIQRWLPSNTQRLSQGHTPKLLREPAAGAWAPDGLGRGGRVGPARPAATAAPSGGGTTDDRPTDCAGGAGRAPAAGVRVRAPGR